MHNYLEKVAAALRVLVVIGTIVDIIVGMRVWVTISGGGGGDGDGRVWSTRAGEFLFKENVKARLISCQVDIFETKRDGLYINVSSLLILISLFKK